MSVRHIYRCNCMKCPYGIFRDYVTLIGTFLIMIITITTTAIIMWQFQHLCLDFCHCRRFIILLTCVLLYRCCHHNYERCICMGHRTRSTCNRWVCQRSDYAVLRCQDVFEYWKLPAVIVIWSRCGTYIKSYKSSVSVNILLPFLINSNGKGIDHTCMPLPAVCHPKALYFWAVQVSVVIY